MNIIDEFDLFLFDLDGLLVNTEWLHYEAYKKMLADRGYDIGIDFPQYFQFAQQDAHALNEFVYKTFPKLKSEEPDWSVLYAEKRVALLRLLDSTKVPLMPGVEQFLNLLAKTDKKRCVVTHSSRLLVDRITLHQPLLLVIDNWITREDYTNPKPAPDGYLKAIEKFAAPADRIVGFEDSERGMRALMGTKAEPLFINNIDPKTKMLFEKEGVRTFRSFSELFVDNSY